MIILSHRGLWNKPNEQNTLSAFRKSYSCGFGIETDIRESMGELVVSHDVPKENNILVSDFLADYREYGNDLPLALNIKSDGLCLMLKEFLHEYNVSNYFVFDMSVPDSLSYLNNNCNSYIRMSEYEKTLYRINDFEGFWLDEFETHWINGKFLSECLEMNKNVCIVSPDLHKRDYAVEWADYKAFEKKTGKNRIFLCTDFPREAKEFFNYG